MNKNEEGTNSLFKSEFYFDLKETSAEISSATGVKDVSIASAKLVGKTLCNTAVFTGKAGIKLAKNLPEITVKIIERRLNSSSNIEPRKREEMEDFLEKNKSGL
ncbi:hypothetical protein IMCC1989_861 [gamma proteobacterium IMCC1989]|nr:hypothetical protein IMCC1989_861 [gamma proteobacterium IMCC1989]